MDADARAQVRSDLMSNLNWPVTSGEVQAVAEQSVDERWRADVAAAATRLPDNGTYLEIDELWADLDPHLEEVVHNL